MLSQTQLSSSTLDAALGSVAHRGREAQREPLDAAALFLGFSRLGHANPYPRSLHARDW